MMPTPFEQGPHSGRGLFPQGHGLRGAERGSEFFQSDVDVIVDEFQNGVESYYSDEFMVCVPKIRFCNIGDEARQGQVVM
jgi:hypothetical protein